MVLCLGQTHCLIRESDMGKDHLNAVNFLKRQGAENAIGLGDGRANSAREQSKRG